MTELLHLTTFGLYALAAALLGISLARSDRRLTRIGTLVTGAALLVHGSALAQYAAHWGELPLVGLGPCLSSIALLVGVGSLIAATLWRAGPVGLVLAPVAALLVGAALVVGIVPTGEPVAFRGPWFVLHVVFAFAGYAGLTVAFAAGLMYLLQFRELKSKRFGAIFRFFPPLDTLDRLGRQGLLLGFPFLTIGLVVGWAWTERFDQALAPGNPKVIWGVLSWAVFTAALLARTGSGRRGHRAALASVLGFVVVVITYIVLRVGESHAGGFL